jgi:hypothetical protein
MKVESHIINNSRIAEVISEDTVVSNIEDGINLLGDLYYQGFDKIILYEKHLVPEFFDLKTGIAGEILQKFSNYRVQLFIIGEFTAFTSKSFKDFVYESNKGKHVNFVGSRAEAIGI